MKTWLVVSKKELIIEINNIMGNQFKNVAVVTCLKIFLFAFNIIFWLIGLVMLIGGIRAEYNPHKYMDLALDPSGTAAYVLIGIGGVMVIITSIAFSSIIKGQPVLLYTYGGFLACIFMMNAGVGATIICYRDSFGDAIREAYTESIMTSNQTKTNMDVTQENFHCCGVSNYTDWTLLSPLKVIPRSCCLDKQNCVTANYSKVYQRGCYEVIAEYLHNYMHIMVGVAVGTALLPLIGMLLSCYLANYVKKSKYDAIN